MVTLAGDEKVARWTAEVPHPFGEDEALDYIEWARAENRMLFAVETLAEGVFIGCIRVDREADDRGNIGYWIGRPYWGRGYGSEALKRVVRFGFEQADLATIEAEVVRGNVASEAVLGKAGFKKIAEGVGHHGRCDGMPVFQYKLARDAWVAASAAKPTVLVVAVAMVDPDGRVLMAKRPEGKKRAGLWEFPGGKVEEGETPETALVRELAEELGIDVTHDCLAPLSFASHGYQAFHLLMPLYVCRKWSGSAISREGQNLKWVFPRELYDIDMPPADIPLIAILRDTL